MLTTSNNEQSPNTPTPLLPIDNQNRIAALDILRGLCLIGILFMNIEWFTRPMMSLEFQDKGLDHAVGWLIRCFVEGKFYKLFSLLFGMGFAVMLLRAKAAGRPFGAWFSRRMFVLWVFGLGHMIFLWGGDILHSYALAGFILLFIVLRKKNQSAKSYLKLSLTWLIIPLVAVSLVGIIWGSVVDHEEAKKIWNSDVDIHSAIKKALTQQETTNVLENDSVDAKSQIPQEDIQAFELSDEEIRAIFIEEAIQERKEFAADLIAEKKAFTQDSYWEATKYRINFAGFAMMISTVLSLFTLVPIFLLGYWLVISERITHSEQHHDFFKILTYVGLCLGVPLNIAGVLIGQLPAYEISLELQIIGGALFYVAQFVLSAGYLGLVICVLHRENGRKFLSIFSPMGQMALTNYLMHSVILTSVFYGYAGGQYGEISRAPQVLIVFCIIAGQIVLSKLWLSYYRFGPMEWLWRSLTYKKLQPMRL